MCPSRSPALLASWTPRSNHEERLDESNKGSRLPLGTLVPGVPSIPPHRRSSPDSPRRARGEGVGERPVQLLNEGLRTRLFTLGIPRGAFRHPRLRNNLVRIHHMLATAHAVTRGFSHSKGERNKTRSVLTRAQHPTTRCCLARARHVLRFLQPEPGAAGGRPRVRS